MNLHRSVFSGRNFEYHSADGVLSGWMAANEVIGAQSTGLKCTAKHAVLNDQETNRRDHGDTASFATEQAIREIYLKTFEIVIEKGDCYAAMTSMARTGYRYARENYDLIAGVLRGEFGLLGPIITDYGPVGPSHSEGCVAAGVSLQLYSQPNSTLETQSPGVQYMLREAAHRTLYGYANGIVMNGLTHGVKYNPGFPVYVLLMIALDLYIAAMAFTMLYFPMRAAILPEGEAAAFSAKTKWTRMILWIVFGAIALALVIVFIVRFLPALVQAFQVT